MVCDLDVRLPPNGLKTLSVKFTVGLEALIVTVLIVLKLQVMICEVGVNATEGVTVFIPTQKTESALHFVTGSVIVTV
jgi:hypothetical protein